MIVELAPRFLTWDDVDPAQHFFDSASAPKAVRSLGAARKVPSPSDDPELRDWSWSEGRPWADAMSQALAEHYGRWAVGWRWAHDEGDFDGGPVGNWCCAPHSITTPEETLTRVVAALREWREWLESLAGWFDEYPLDLAGIEDQRILWERAARNLILQVTDRTGCGSGWHGHCRQVLTWFLSRWGVAPDRAQKLVDEAVGGRFASWTCPDTVLVDDVAEELAMSLRPDDGTQSAGPAADHLERWLAVRAAVPWRDAPGGGGDGPVAPSRDGAADDIRAFDGALDPDRARGMLAALDLLRADAAHGALLDFERLQRWQQHVLGTPQPPPFRDLPAFAKGGRERYGIGPDTRARLDACLAESARRTGQLLPLTARAARAYLDVCFFHPFDDGNARSAFLALVFVLAREGVALDGVSLLRRVTFQADEPEDAVILTRYIDIHLAETRRNSASPAS
ncbi:Fic family protein [Streptomyces griseorubiginosus]|uniref:Cell filamentation protein Fic n=1 Tax=Streptomyces griseorubiginosus TaxID=67304 RepID=A0A101RN16_9ACTN|nr:Fic family protein [Streptomyces griseorubiginosus]KUN58563.1 cell filamentation protein Fic [Streptomyces griseorubiginosus]